MKILVLYYSLHGHTYAMARAAAEGARSVEGADVDLRRVPETLPPEIIETVGAVEAQAAQADVPVCTLDELAAADAVVFGTPTRFGNMCGQMRLFLDSTGALWTKRVLAGKVGGVFTGSGTQHGGQESTILSFHTTLLHHGMIVAGLPYTFEGQSRMDEITGCSPYGASTIVGPGHDRGPSQNELDGARYQGRYVAMIAKKLAAGPRY
jgi:NAD(P)H dehydrogenase (quinone)